MPNFKNWWIQAKTLFQSATNIELLEIELQKDPIMPDQILKLVREQCLKKEAFPMRLFELNSVALIQALERVTQETPYHKKIICHDTWDLFQQQTKIEKGEVHCVLVRTSSDDITNFFDVPPFSYGIGYKMLNQVYHYLDLQIETPDIHTPVEPVNSPNNLAKLDHELTNKGFVLTNAPLINQACRELDNYYFLLASQSFGKIDEVGELELALKNCLKLTSSENDEDPNTRFKVAVTECYLADTEENLEAISPVVFSQIKTSHQDPNRAFEFIRKEKNKKAVVLGM